jgi:hypothetical protein
VGAVLYSQWFPGKANGLSDVLSQDSHLTDDDLTSAAPSIPLQVPLNLDICPLPPAILLGDLTSAVSASDQGVEQGTHQKHLALDAMDKVA